MRGSHRRASSGRIPSMVTEADEERDRGRFEGDRSSDGLGRARQLTPGVVKDERIGAIALVDLAREGSGPGIVGTGRGRGSRAVGGLPSPAVGWPDRPVLPLGLEVCLGLVIGQVRGIERRLS